MIYLKYLSFPKTYSLFYSVCSFAALMMTLFGVILSLVSCGVLGIWVGMELNFLGAVCFMSGIYVEESESVMKYFIVQVMGSCFLILGILMMVYPYFSFSVESFILLGLSVKLGIFPFYFWVPGVMSSLSWFACFIVSVVQKIAPLWFLCNFCFGNSIINLIEVMAVLTSMVGCLGGLGMLNYRALMGYSSLVHLGFLVILSLTEVSFFMGYLVFYSLLNGGLMWSLWVLGVYSYSDFICEGSFIYYMEFWWVALYFFSLSGIPPFSGIFLKVYFLVSCWTFAPLGCVVCFLSSAVSMYFYMSVLMEMLIFWGKSTSNMVSGVNNWNISKVMVVSLLVNLVISYPLFLLSGV
uniref:NADH-ubiquinone oxidoreductase chain 2 n=1 Tax=Cyclina sinensis TaxID=120566 RepID=A0A125S9T9_CYCSN|nr:NADH dehydrogenase subunit 2 [Cyclina sinensis]